MAYAPVTGEVFGGRSNISLKAAETPLTPRLTPLAHRQDNHFAVVTTIERDIAVGAEIDRPFAKSGIDVVGGASDLRIGGRQSDTGANGLDRARGRAGIFRL